MLDIKFIKENPSIIKEDLKKRNESKMLPWVDDVIKNYEDSLSFKKQSENLRQKRNTISKKINQLQKENRPAHREIQEAKTLPKKISGIEEKLLKAQEKVRYYLLRLPNVLHKSVPIGKDDTENKVVRKVGTPKKNPGKSHADLLTDLNLLDGERAGKIAGHGFFYLKDELALLDFALMQFTMHFMKKRGYTIIEPPFMLKRKPYTGVTDLEAFEDVLYKIENEDLYLIATSEHPIGAMHMNEVFNKEDLPRKYVGISPCFRKEVGAHGKYTRGLFRMHHFNKIEQFIFSNPEDSWKYHEELQKNCEDLYKKLGIPFQVVNVCTGDIGSIAAKKFDIEILMADGEYREAGSNSNCTDYQARRLNIKYRDRPGLPPKDFVHTLNNTAIATSRAMIGIIETHQLKDGSIKIPAVLQPYMGGIKKISKIK